jgi:hypothetical protein
MDTKQMWSTVKAIGEGLWNGTVVSGILVMSAYLIKFVPTLLLG